MDLIFYILIGGLFVFNVISFFRNRKSDNFVYKIVFFSRHTDWLLAILLVVFVITLAVIVEPLVPQFLKWSLFSLIGKDGTNANVEIINQSLNISPIILIIVFAFLLLFLPKVAYWEEVRFRYGITKINSKAILTNLKFGLYHCLVGVPIWIGLLLGVVGFIFSLIYIHQYKKSNDLTIAVHSSTSLHGKYNIILIVLLIITLIKP